MMRRRRRRRKSVVGRNENFFTHFVVEYCVRKIMGFAAIDCNHVSIDARHSSKVAMDESSGLNTGTGGTDGCNTCNCSASETKAVYLR